MGWAVLLMSGRSLGGIPLFSPLGLADGVASESYGSDEFLCSRSEHWQESCATC